MGKLTRAPRLAIVNGKIVTTSRAVALSFGKRHDNILRTIRQLIENLPERGRLNFEETRYIDESNGKEFSEYRLTRDGFALLTMAFNGKEHLEFKLAFLDRFNFMAEKLQEKQQKQALAGMKSARSAPKSVVNKPLFLAHDPASMIGKDVPEVPAGLEIPPELKEAIDARAMGLAGECLPAFRSYLRRAMVHRAMYGGVTMPLALDADRARAALASSGLADALAFEASHSLRAIKTQAAVISQVVANYAREIEAIPA